MSVSICNRFHARRANSGKIKTFGEMLSFTPLFEKTLRTVTQNFVKNYSFVAPHIEDFVILACIVLIGLQNVTDGQTDA